RLKSRRFKGESEPPHVGCYDFQTRSKVGGSVAEDSGEELCEVLITFDLPLSEKLSLDDSLALISKQGYQRLLMDGQIVRLDSRGSHVPAPARTTERVQFFSSHFHCAACDLEYREPSPALFSFNHPLGACPTCRGFGRTISIDYNLAVPDRAKTLGQGAIKPW